MSSRRDAHDVGISKDERVGREDTPAPGGSATRRLGVMP